VSDARLAAADPMPGRAPPSRQERRLPGGSAASPRPRWTDAPPTWSSPRPPRWRRWSRNEHPECRGALDRGMDPIGVRTRPPTDRASARSPVPIPPQLAVDPADGEWQAAYLQVW